MQREHRKTGNNIKANSKIVYERENRKRFVRAKVGWSEIKRDMEGEGLVKALTKRGDGISLHQRRKYCQSHRREISWDSAWAITLEQKTEKTSWMWSRLLQRVCVLCWDLWYLLVPQSDLLVPQSWKHFDPGISHMSHPNRDCMDKSSTLLAVI